MSISHDCRRKYPPTHFHTPKERGGPGEGERTRGRMLEKKSTYIHALSAHAKGGRRLIVLSLSLFAYSISPHYPGHSEAICELAHAGEKDATFDRNHSSTEYDRWLHVSKKSWLVPVQNKDVRPHICTLRMRVRRARVYTHTHTRAHPSRLPGHPKSVETDSRRRI